MHVSVDSFVNRPTGGSKTITLIQLEVHKFNYFEIIVNNSQFSQITLYMSTYDHLILFPFTVIVIN